MNYFICGFTGAGKTTLLKKLAQELAGGNYKFIDLDSYLLDRYSHYESIASLIQKEGEPQFREWELDAIVDLSNDENCFVALGGGALNLQTKDLLNSDAWVGFWLNTPMKVCIKRVLGDLSRPIAASKTEEELELLYQQRAELYKLFQPIESTIDIRNSLTHRGKIT